MFKIISYAVIIALCFIGFSSFPVNADLVFNMDKSNYDKGDMLTISGNTDADYYPVSSMASIQNPKIVDAFGNSLSSMSVDQQAQITVDITNNQDHVQPFAYLVRIQDENGATVSISWITGSLVAYQSFSPSLSWIPSVPGVYTARIFVWSGIAETTPIPLAEPIDFTFFVDPTAHYQADGPVITNTQNVEDVIIQIFNPLNTIIDVSQLSSDGNFIESFDTSGILWKTPGTYTVKVIQGGIEYKGYFTFNTKSSNVPITKSFSIHDENNYFYDVKIKTKSIVKDVMFNRNKGKLSMDLSGPQGLPGFIEMEIPKSMFIAIDKVMYAGKLVPDAQIITTDTSYIISYNYNHYSLSEVLGPADNQIRLDDQHAVFYYWKGHQNSIAINPTDENILGLEFQKTGSHKEPSTASFKLTIPLISFETRSITSSSGISDIILSPTLFVYDNSYVLQMYVDKLDERDFKKEASPPIKIRTIPNPTEPPNNCEMGSHIENGICVPDVKPVSNPDKKGCLIATAAFGSELAPQVQLLREVRDNVLFSTVSGTSFMSTFNSIYYSLSPTIADWERQNPMFKETVKVTITPMLSTLLILNYVHIDSESEMFTYGIGIILLNVGIYFVAPIIIIKKLSDVKRIIF